MTHFGSSVTQRSAAVSQTLFACPRISTSDFNWNSFSPGSIEVTVEMWSLTHWIAGGIQGCWLLTIIQCMYSYVDSLASVTNEDECIQPGSYILRGNDKFVSKHLLQGNVRCGESKRLWSRGNWRTDNPAVFEVMYKTKERVCLEGLGRFE